MSEEIKIGDPVKIFLDSKFGDRSDWYAGIVFKIEPYSQHRSFYWVELSQEAQAILNTKQISVFNVKNIQKVEAK